MPTKNSAYFSIQMDKHCWGFFGFGFDLLQLYVNIRKVHESQKCAKQKKAVFLHHKSKNHRKKLDGNFAYLKENETMHHQNGLTFPVASSSVSCREQTTFPLKLVNIKLFKLKMA